MTAIRTALVSCDGCGETYPPETFREATAVELRDELRRLEDWHQRPGGRDICGYCWVDGKR